MLYFSDTFLHIQKLQANLLSVLRKQRDENNFFHMTPIGNTQNGCLVELSLPSLKEGNVVNMDNKGNYWEE